jgi:hypothetical protein
VIPKTVFQLLSRQKLPALYEIRDLVNDLITDAESVPEPSAIKGDGEILEVKRSGPVTYRLERVSCGKGCSGCPHGPYWYGYWNEGGKTRSKYIGKRLA